jgi:hypothetical protein
LSGQGAYECILVCKAWHELAIQVFYKEVIMARFRVSYFKYGGLVQKLSIACDNVEYLDTSDSDSSEESGSA